MLLISPAAQGRRVINLDRGNGEREKARTGNKWRREKRTKRQAENWRIITLNSTRTYFKSLFMHNWPRPLRLRAAKRCKNKAQSICWCFLPSPSTPPPRPDFPWRTDCDSQHSIMVRRAAAFKAQIDVSDIIVSLHKTVGRGSKGRSLAGGSGSKLTVVCNIKHFPDPQARR